MGPLPAPPAIYCLDCGYLLHGLREPRCPECGRTFDPRDPETFARSSRRFKLIGAARTVPFVTPLVLLSVWWVHVALTLMDDPLGDGFDLALFFVTMVLKLATVASLLFVLGQVYAAIAGRPRAAAITFLCWCGCSLAVVGGWAVLREHAAPVIRNDAAAYMTMTHVPSYEEGRLDFHARWPRGRIFAAELGLAIILCALHALLGLYAGRYAVLAVPAGIVLTLLLLAVHIVVFRLVDFDFDIFHADIFSGALAIDLLYFFAGVDPYTSIASTVYAAVALSSWWIVRQYGQSSPTPK